MLITKEKRVIEEKYRARRFRSKIYPGFFYEFAVDADNNTVFKTPEAQNNYKYALNNPQEYEDEGIIEEIRTYTEPAEGKCRCGNRVYVENRHHGAFCCDRCGQWYNLFGQELLPPEFWGE